MPVRSGVQSVRHLHEHMLWDGDATGVFQQQQYNVTTMSAQSKSCSGVVVKFNYWVGNCQRNSSAKNSKY